MPKPKSMSELVREELRKGPVAHAIPIPSRAADDPDVSRIRSNGRSAAGSFGYLWLFLIGDEPNGDPTALHTVVDTVLGNTSVGLTSQCPLFLVPQR